MKVFSFLLIFALTSTAALAEVSSSKLDVPTNHANWTGQEISFANGAKIKLSGSTMTTTSVDGKTTVSDRSKFPPPRIMASCRYMKHWLDITPIDNPFWNSNSLTWANSCL